MMRNFFLGFAMVESLVMAFAQTQAMTPFAALQCPELGACWFKDADPTVWKPIWKGQQTRRTVELKELSKEHVAAKS
eukprot:CAMPEP_0178443684 /NCGR_PEP_ID=MMETSP0689_2-20121128/39044_1 /TAXON_ID=160604 /ORGANISM="Amphidinium massartii, Strain CS-259" /LENGTH=76 /DNA_ID=CAMNT_0020067743 /DNA_START=32 /DNA_END=259 /DNA_ORIENTATION=-